MKAIFVVMNTTWAVVKISPEKSSGLYGIWTYEPMTSAILVSQRSRDQIPYGPEFFFRPYFHYCSSSVHYCESHFHIQRRHCWLWQYAGRVSHELRNRPRSPWLSGRASEHGIRRSWGLISHSEFFFVPRPWPDGKYLFLIRSYSSYREKVGSRKGLEFTEFKLAGFNCERRTRGINNFNLRPQGGSMEKDT